MTIRGASPVACTSLIRSLVARTHAWSPAALLMRASSVLPDLAHCGVVGLPGGWLLLGLWGLRGLGCALTWGYESVRSHGQDGVGGPCGADCALLPEGARSIEHIGSAHDDAELAVLKEVARQRLNAGQLSFDLLGLNSENDAGSAPQEPAGTGCVAPIASNRMGVLLEALEVAWKAVGLDRLDGADEVFRQLVTARLIEPTSKQDSLRVLTEAGLSPVSYATVKRHLPSYAAEDFTRNLSRLLAGYARIGRASLVLFDAYDPVLPGPTRPTAFASRACPRKDAWSRRSR